MFLLVVVGLGSTASAQAAERVQLTWDTDATDIDLHVWDTGGAHAWYSDQDGISRSELSTDITYGFGPERFEEFSGSENRTYTVGVCYFGANRDDEVVPPTTATINITDPGGRVRTLRRRLVREGESFLLGSTPEGDRRAYDPGGGWCRGSSEPPHRPTDDGGAGTPSVQPSNPTPYDFLGCARTKRTVGSVEVCANEISGEGPTYSMRGDVRVNGTVLLGDAPVTINTDAKTVNSPAPVLLRVARAGGEVPVAAGLLSIDAKAVTDPVSGRDRLATVRLASPQLTELAISKLKLAVPLEDSSLKLLLDQRDGGGVIFSAAVKLPLGGERTSATTIAAGVHARSPAAVRLLGGSVAFSPIALANGWGFSELKLSYAEATDTWTASGGFIAPAFGFDAQGSLVGGQLNSIGMSISRDVPLGPSGFILSKVGGSLDGIAVPPLKITATASGRWGSVPGVNGVGLINLNDVALTLNLSGSVSLSGNVDFIKNNSPVKGTIALKFALNPFYAAGKLNAEAMLGLIEQKFDAGIAMSSSAFTATGGASGKLTGLPIRSGRAVVSDRGLGVTADLCIGAFGRCAKTITVGAGMNWSEYPRPRLIGSDIQQFATIRLRAGATAGRQIIRVPAGRPLLIVDASGPEGTTTPLTLRSPEGKTYRTGGRRPDQATVIEPQTGYTSLTVISPEPGRWVLSSPTPAPGTTLSSQTVRRIQRVTIRRVTPRKLKKSSRIVRLAWSSRGLGSTASVSLYTSPTSTGVGFPVLAANRARASVRLPVSRLLRGRNYLHLLVTVNGRAVDDVRIRKPLVRR